MLLNAIRGLDRTPSGTVHVHTNAITIAQPNQPPKSCFVCRLVDHTAANCRFIGVQPDNHYKPQYCGHEEAALRIQNMMASRDPTAEAVARTALEKSQAIRQAYEALIRQPSPPPQAAHHGNITLAEAVADAVASSAETVDSDGSDVDRRLSFPEPRRTERAVMYPPAMGAPMGSTPGTDQRRQFYQEQAAEHRLSAAAIEQHQEALRNNRPTAPRSLRSQARDNRRRTRSPTVHPELDDELEQLERRMTEDRIRATMLRKKKELVAKHQKELEKLDRSYQKQRRNRSE